MFTVNVRISQKSKLKLNEKGNSGFDEVTRMQAPASSPRRMLVLKQASMPKLLFGVNVVCLQLAVEKERDKSATFLQRENKHRSSLL